MIQVYCGYKHLILAITVHAPPSPCVCKGLGILLTINSTNSFSHKIKLPHICGGVFLPHIEFDKVSV